MRIKILRKVLLLATIITFNLQLETLNCSAQYVTIPDGYFVEFLQANFPGCMNGNKLDTNCAALQNIITIDCSADTIGNLYGIQYFKNLDTLMCFNNNITTLSTLPSSLLYLDCDDNLLASLPVLPPSINYLDCSGNYLTQLPALPDSLGYFDCSSNDLPNLPVLPSGLQIFGCSYNLLTSLPVLPASLLGLYCYGNELTGLPTLPEQLQYIDCSFNPIATLPELPASLNTLYCVEDTLTTLPSLPNSLSTLICFSNQLTSLPTLPDSMYYLDINNNPNLSCLPEITTIANFIFTGTNVNCVLDYGQVYLSTPSIDSLPLCSAHNPNGCYPTGVRELQVSGSRFQVFPNPASGSFTISSSEELDNAVVEIYNVVGEKVSSIKYQDTHLTVGQARLMTINISYLPAGMYFVRVSNGQQEFNDKLIVQ